MQQHEKKSKFRLVLVLGGVALFFYVAGIVSIAVA